LLFEYFFWNYGVPPPSNALYRQRKNIMLTATYLTKDSMARAALVCAISFSLGSAAMAAESEASSMAGGMPQSGATVSATSSAAETGSSQSSGSSSSLSSTDRSTAASAYDSSLTGAGPAVAVKNIATDTAALKNPTLPAGGIQSPSNKNGLIQNDVNQKDIDLPANGGAASKLSGASPSTTAAKTRVPHEKVQYWNQRRSSRTKQH
jgi:hypothetical protein